MIAASRLFARTDDPGNTPNNYGIFSALCRQLIGVIIIVSPACTTWYQAPGPGFEEIVSWLLPNALNAAKRAQKKALMCPNCGCAASGSGRLLAYEYRSKTEILGLPWVEKMHQQPHQ